MKTRITIGIAFGAYLLLACAVAGAESLSGTVAVGSVAAFSLESPAFAANAAIPGKHTADGTNVSPAVHWCNPPTGVQSWVLTVVDPDGSNWVHWIVYDLPATLTGLSENAGATGDANLPAGAKHGYNSYYQFNMGGTYYQGPEPPPGESHRYVFTLYGLDIAALPVSAPNLYLNNVVTAMTGHILTQVSLTGGYPNAVPDAVTVNGGLANAVEGITVEGGALGVRVTDRCGHFVFSGLQAGTQYTIVPSSNSYTFQPNGAAGTLTTDTIHDFIATLVATPTATPTSTPTVTPTPGTTPGTPGETPTPAPACYSLKTKVKPSKSGTVAAKPASNCSGGYITGTQVTLTAKPKRGFRLLSWTGSAKGKKKSVKLTMNGNKTVTANFKGGR